jgi:hypothetical protein
MEPDSLHIGRAVARSCDRGYDPRVSATSVYERRRDERTIDRRSDDFVLVLVIRVGVDSILGFNRSLGLALLPPPRDPSHIHSAPVGQLGPRTGPRC